MSLKLWRKVEPGTEVIPLWRVLSMLEHIESKADNPQEVLSLCKEYSQIMIIDSFRFFENNKQN